MKKQILLIQFFIFFVFYNSIAQKNKIQLRYNFIGNNYEQLFGSYIPYYNFNGDEEKFINKVNSHPFFYHEFNNYVDAYNGTFLDEKIYTKYYYIGLAYQRDSIFSNYFFRFRIDKFYFNYKSQTTDNGWLVSGYNYRNISSEIKNSSLQFTPGFGKQLNCKFISIDLGVELPFYFRGDEESFSTSYWITDSTQNYGSIFSFKPEGWFTGISFFCSPHFSLQKHWSISLEGSVGFIYLNNFGYKETRFIFHYPALTLSYKF